MHFDAQPAITVIAAFALEPVARLEQVLCEVVELCWFHLAGLSDVDVAVLASCDLAHGCGLASKGEADAQFFNFHVFAIEVDGHGLAFDRNGHGFHVGLRLGW